MTQDVDVSLFCEFGNEREIIGEILDRFQLEYKIQPILPNSLESSW